MFDLIAQYFEVRPNGRRHFELFKDRVFIRSRTARVDAEITVMLANLRPDPNRLRVRPKQFGHGLVLLLTAMVVAIAAALTGRLAADPKLWGVVGFSIAGGAGFVALVVLSQTARKIEFVQFVSHQGAVLLDVGRSGPGRPEFDAFVETLIAQIRANQGPSPAAMVTL